MHYLANSTAHCGGQLRKGRGGCWSKDSEIASHWMIGRWHGRRVGDTVMVAAIKTLALTDCDSEEMPELKYTHGEVCPRLRIWQIQHHTSFQDTVGGIGSKYTPVPTWKLPKEQVGILYAEESSRRPPERLKFALRSDPVVPTVGMWKQRDPEFEDRLDYTARFKNKERFLWL